MTATASKAVRRGMLDGMALIKGGSFLMGADDYYPEEAPIRRATRCGGRGGRRRW